MKKTALILLSVFLYLNLTNSVSAIGTTPTDWYIVPNGNKQPVFGTDLSYVDKYNGFYLDKKAKDDDKVIYLTFDAGYENGNVEKILDTLKAHNASGAFFILSHMVKSYTDLIKRMADEGHLVCNHTCSHKDMSQINDIDSFAEELTKLETLYKEKTGKDMPKFYRPPSGRFSEQNMDFANRLGYKTIFWSFAYADWDNNKQPSLEKAKEKILSNTHNGMVLLLHPTSSTNAAILDDLLREWKKQGYRFGNLYELTEG